MKSTKKQIAKSAVMLAFAGSLLAFGISSYAWFVNNQVSDGHGLSTKVDVDTDLVDIDFMLYKYDRDEKVGVGYKQSSTDFDLALNDFDNFIRDRNVNNNNIIRFHVTLPNSEGSTAEFRTVTVSSTVRATTEGETFDGAFGDSERRTYNDTVGYKYHNIDESADYTCNNISNIIYFKSFMYSYSTVDYTDKEHPVTTETKKVPSLNFDEYNPDDSEDNDKVYKDVTEHFATLETKFSFVQNGNKSAQIQFSMDQIPAKTSELIFFVEYNYNIDLIDSFLTNTEKISGAQDTEILASKIHFMKDIESIKISSSEVK